MHRLKRALNIIVRSLMRTMDHDREQLGMFDEILKQIGGNTTRKIVNRLQRKMIIISVTTNVSTRLIWSVKKN